jgi:acyl-coenzyme A synthetase/AMP-(fatty) acid ligase
MLGLKKALNDGYAGTDTVSDFWYTTLNNVGAAKPSIIMCEDDGSERTWTFGDLEAYSNRVANFFIAQGVNEDDTIALFMENRPEFIGTWLGATKVGCSIWEIFLCI